MTFSVKMSLWKAHVQRALIELEKLYPTTSVGTYPGHDPNESQAADFMIPGYATGLGIALGDRLAKQLATVETCKRLGIWYIIWRRRIWSMTRPEKGWLTYTNPNPAIRGTASGDHLNHVHVSFYADDPQPPAPVHLPTYVVTSECYAVRPSDASIKLRPVGFEITTAVAVTASLLTTESDYRYPVPCLKLQES